jgi:hypothetical protein
MANVGLIRAWRTRGKSILWIAEKTGLTKVEVSRRLYRRDKHRTKPQANRDDNEGMESATERTGLVLLIEAAKRTTRGIASGTGTGDIPRTEF